MPSIDQYTRREARIRGSGNREIKVDQLNISSSDGKHDSDPVKPEDTPWDNQAEEPLGQVSTNQISTNSNQPSIPSRNSTQNHIQKPPKDDKQPSRRRSNQQKHLKPSDEALREKRKLTFSSDEDDEDDFKPLNYNVSHTTKPSKLDATKDDLQTSMHIDYSGLDYDIDADPMDHNGSHPSEANPIKQEVMEDKPAKRKRGRPKKGEAQKKTTTVTRRSRRVVDKPMLRKSHVSEPPKVIHPKPFSSMALLLAHRAKPEQHTGARSLGSNSKGKQRPLAIDSERLYTASTRDRRFNLTTLDVLKHFVDDHSPRPSANEVISENVVLTEFKAHLKFYLDHLSDLHSSVGDISHDLVSVQRKKNEVRRSILELQKKHSSVGAELAVERRKYYEMKEKHHEFMNMVGAIGELKTAISGESQAPDLSAHVMSSLTDLQRVLNPNYGLPAQLQSVVKSLGELQGQKH